MSPGFNDRTLAMNSSSISIPLRYVIILTMLGITFSTGLTITLISLSQNQGARKLLAQSVGYQISLNINQNLDRLIYETEDFVNATERIHQKTNADGTNNKVFFEALANHLIEHPGYGIITYMEEKTGKTFLLYPAKSNQFVFKSILHSSEPIAEETNTETDVTLIEYLPNPRNGTVTQKKYQFANYPDKPFEILPDLPLDFRNTPSYLLGKSMPVNSKSRWTESYRINNTPDFTIHRSGTHCVKSLFHKNGDLAAVIGMDIGNYMISDYLASLLKDIHTQNLKGFIFEKHEDGSNILIAHSLREETFPRDENGKLILISHPKDAKDPAISSMIKSLPEEFKRIPDMPGHKLFTFEDHGKSYLGSSTILVPGQMPWWVLCLYIPEDVFYARAYEQFHFTMLITLLIMIASTILSIYFSHMASESLENLAHFAAKVGKFDFKYQIKTHNLYVKEIQYLTKSMILMQTGLQSFTQYLPKDMLKSLFDTGTIAKPGGKEKDVSILFADIVNFTHYSEILSPDDLILQLNEFLGCFSSVIIKNHGTVDKYIGDAVMAYWNAPRDCADHPFESCKTAIQGVHNLSFLQNEWARLNKPIFRVRIGINTGSVVLGNIGTEEHLSYTVMGDNVNLASRLEGLNKVYGTSILISESTLKACGDKLVTRPIDLVAVKGKERKILVHELIGIAGETSGTTVRFCEEFKAVFAVYLNKDWARALQLFEKIAELHPDDVVTKIHLDRCKEFVINPPDPSWDGGQVFFQK